MATQQKEFLIRVAADIKNAQAQLTAVSKELDSLSESGGGAGEGLKETKKAADEVTNSVDVLSGTVKRFITVAAALTIAKQFVDANLQIQALNATLTAATGSAAAAGSEYAFLHQQAERLGLSIGALGKPYAQLLAASKGTVLEGQATRDVFLAIAEASSVLKLSAPESERALRAIQQIMSKGTVSAEELRLQLGDVIPGAMQIAARATGVTTEQFQKMLANGEVLSNEFLPKFAEEMRKTFGGGLEQSTQGLQAALNRLKNSFFDLAGAIGEAGVTTALTNVASGISGLTDGITLLIAKQKELKGGFSAGIGIDEINKELQAKRDKEREAELTKDHPLTPVNLPEIRIAQADAAKAAADIEQNRVALERLLKTYERQAIALNEGAAGVLAYDLSLMNLTGTADATVDKILAMFNAQVKYREEIERSKAVEKQNIEIMRQRNALMDEGTRLQESLRTPIEAYIEQTAKLNEMVNEGAITQEVYNRALTKAGRELEALAEKSAVQIKVMDADAKKFAGTMEGAFSTLFFDVLDGKFENMADNFSRALKRMIAEMVASRLFAAIGGGGVAAGSGNSVPATAPSGQFAAVNSGISARSTTGLTQPEPVTLSQDAAQGGNVTVILENKGTPQTAQQGRAQFDARGLVVSIVTDDLRSGGPIATTMERTYNTRRKV